MASRAALSSALFLVLTIACEAATTPKLPAGYLQVPLTEQSTEYSCGPASLLAVLRYWKVCDQDETALYPLLKTTPKDGTHPARLAEAARHFGLQAKLQEKMSLAELSEALRRGETVILDIQAWPEKDATPDDWSDNWEDGHYVVLVGQDQDFVYLMDPSTHMGYGYIPRSEFFGRWHDYENEGGKRRVYQQLGVVISGKERLAAFPAPLQRVL